MPKGARSFAFMATDVETQLFGSFEKKGSVLEELLLGDCKKNIVAGSKLIGVMDHVKSCF